MASTLIEEVAAGRAPAVVPLTVEQYHRMLQSGILSDGDPMEFIEGLLVRKDRAVRGGDPMTHGDDHALVVERLLRRFFAAAPSEEWRVRSQLPAALSPTSEPEPDLTLARGTGGSHPRPDEILLVVEVADSSLIYDRSTKQRLYAAAGIPAYWIVNIPERQIEVYAEPLPSQGRYRHRTDLAPGQTLRFPLGEAVVVEIPVADLSPEAK